MGKPIRTLILGAAGRDFHNFNVCYRDDEGHRVVAFTAAQIPGIGGRHYPAALTGPRYPGGIPIFAEEELEKIIRERGVQEVIFAYSDISHEEVMHLASRALAAGADFHLLGPRRTQLASPLPVIAVTAVRTGCGKSPVSRAIARLLREMGFHPVVIRHPMPYGDLARQRVQRFACPEDLDAARCTIEEREEYLPYIAEGGCVFAGVDYAAILEEAAREGDVILWDGGNNDFPFYVTDLHITLLDPHRPGHEHIYHPGETNLRMADILLIAKADTAPAEALATLRASAEAKNPGALIIEGAMPPRMDGAEELRGKRALVIEDGPTVTHGGMPHGAGYLAARAAGAEIVDPRPFAQGSLKTLFDRYPHLGPVLPAMGYTDEQIRELGETIAAAEFDYLVLGTPVDLGGLIRTARPVRRVRYEYADRGSPTLGETLRKWRDARQSGRGE